jgi:hypothetical protein
MTIVKVIHFAHKVALYVSSVEEKVKVVTEIENGGKNKLMNAEIWFHKF